MHKRTLTLGLLLSMALCATGQESAPSATADTLKASKTATKAMKLIQSGKASKTAKGLEMLKAAGSAGLPSACRFLSDYYIHTTPPDTASSVHWLEILGDQGDSATIERLVDIYNGQLSSEGYYKEAQPLKLTEWSKALANTGSIKGAETYATCCLLNNDTTQALGWFEKAAESGSLVSERTLAQLYARPGSNQVGSRAFEYAEKASSKGDQQSLYLLGNMYMQGFGTAQDLSKAISLFEQCDTAEFQDVPLLIANCKVQQNGGKVDASTFSAFLQGAEQGIASAQLFVAQCYANGDGTEKDLAKALSWFEKAAAQGVPYAQYSCAMLYLTGQDPIKPDPAKGMEWLKKAADSGLPEAKTDLGLSYLEGRNIEKDEQKGLELIEQASDMGYPHAQSMMAGVYLNGEEGVKDERKGIMLLQQVANVGDPESQYNLGVCYMSGTGVGTLTQEEKLSNEELKNLSKDGALSDVQIAKYWLEKACEAGHPMAQQNLGLMMLQGAVEGGKEQAVALIKKASDAGLPQSQYTLGMMYLTDASLKQKSSQAISLIKKASDQGFVQAQSDLGLIYLQGIGGVKPNVSQGFSLLKKAAEQGHPSSMLYTAMCYASGTGVKPNAAEARKWLQQASSQSLDPEVSHQAKEALKSMK